MNTVENDNTSSFETACEGIVSQLIAERKRQGISQKELAEKAGITQGQLSRIESGESSPLITTAYAIANALGKTIEVNFEE